MTNEQTGTLVFKDQAGEYYLLPQATLERGRVSAEHKAEVERLISEQHDDVQGHFFALPPIYEEPQIEFPPDQYETGWPRSSSTVRDTSYGGR